MVASGEEDQNVEGHSEVQRRDMPYDIHRHTIDYY
jgi:hypothetical protein